MCLKTVFDHYNNFQLSDSCHLQRDSDQLFTRKCRGSPCSLVDNPVIIIGMTPALVITMATSAQLV